MTVALSDVALERAYLATLMCGAGNEHLASAERLSPLDCAHIEHGRILGLIYELAGKGEELGTLAVRRALEATQANVGTLETFDRIGDAPLRFDSLRAIADRLRDLAVARRTREHLLRAVVAAEQMHIEAAQEHARDAAGEASHARVPILSAQATVAAALGQLCLVEGQRPRIVRSGFPLLDQAIRGLPMQTMLAIGGRTGAGKSSLMLAMALHAATQGLKAGIVSSEDASEVWGGRVLSYLVDVNPERLLEERVDAKLIEEAERGHTIAKQLGLHFAFPLNRPLHDVLSAIRSLVMEHGCQLICVDYLQAIALGTEGKRAELVANAAQRLKSECQTLGVALVLGSQLSRPDKTKPFAEPHVNDLKESGDLENMSEVVLLLWKTSDEDDAQTLGKVAKVKWSPRRPRFELVRDPNSAVRALNHVREQASRHQEPAARRDWGA